MTDPDDGAIESMLEAHVAPSAEELEALEREVVGLARQRRATSPIARFWLFAVPIVLLLVIAVVGPRLPSLGSPDAATTTDPSGTPPTRGETPESPRAIDGVVDRAR